MIPINPIKFNKTDTIFDEIISIATSNINELPDNDLSCLVELLDNARECGWYPFVSVYYYSNGVEFDDRIEEIAEIKKDPYIWEVLMLEKELPIIKKEFNEDYDENGVHEKLKEIILKL